HTPLHPLRSLAVDTEFHVLGLPVFVSAPGLELDAPTSQSNGRSGFHRLMFAHDVGSAIKGCHRGDIYVGSGLEAGRQAGATKHAAYLCPLYPNEFIGALTQ
ncbi:MAG: 3D domain-containing protein, partial [Pseudomonadota bacterium]